MNIHAPWLANGNTRRLASHTGSQPSKGPLPVKSFDSRAYSINDFVEWDSGKQLELSPKFQRRSVWSDKAKSYLIDTILRGKPIPKVFIRQKINVATKSSAREVVDGQQRLRTILSFVKDGFVVSRSHNREYGGLLFSQLPEEVQGMLLSYEVAVDLLINLPDSEVLDIFSRLNSYAVVLNEQEKINANHFGPFKILSDDIARKYNEYWIIQKIFTANQVLRMLEVNLTADLIIAMTVGIKSKKQVGRYYERFENEFQHSMESLEESFDKTVEKIGDIYPEGLGGTEAARPFLFYSLFTAVAHSLFGIPGLEADRVDLQRPASIAGVRNRLDRLEELFAAKDVSTLNVAERTFLQDSRRATTDEAVRVRRTKYLLELMASA